MKEKPNWGTVPTAGVTREILDARINDWKQMLKYGCHEDFINGSVHHTWTEDPAVCLHLLSGRTTPHPYYIVEDYIFDWTDRFPEDYVIALEDVHSAIRAEISFLENIRDELLGVEKCS
jgi:hypothetical protein